MSNRAGRVEGAAAKEATWRHANLMRMNANGLVARTNTREEMSSGRTVMGVYILDQTQINVLAQVER